MHNCIARLKLTQSACYFFFMTCEANQSIILATGESVEDEVGVVRIVTVVLRFHVEGFSLKLWHH